MSRVRIPLAYAIRQGFLAMELTNQGSLRISPVYRTAVVLLSNTGKQGISTGYRCDNSTRNKLGPGWGGLRNITAPGQWFASRRVIRISRPGLSTNVVGVPSGIGFFKRISALGFRYIECFHRWRVLEGSRGTYQEVLEVLVRLHPRLENAPCVVDPAGIPFQAEKHLTGRRGAIHAERSPWSVEKRSPER